MFFFKKFFLLCFRVVFSLLGGHLVAKLELATTVEFTFFAAVLTADALQVEAATFCAFITKCRFEQRTAASANAAACCTVAEVQANRCAARLRRLSRRASERASQQSLRKRTRYNGSCFVGCSFGLRSVWCPPSNPGTRAVQRSTSQHGEGSRGHNLHNVDPKLVPQNFSGSCEV